MDSSWRTTADQYLAADETYFLPNSPVPLVAHRHAPATGTLVDTATGIWEHAGWTLWAYIGSDPQFDLAYVTATDGRLLEADGFVAYPTQYFVWDLEVER